MELTWLGHSAFRLEAEGKRIYIDPFLTGNPKCPEDEQTPERVDVIALTHGHGDHVGDTVELAQKHGPVVIAPVELAAWLDGQGVDEDKVRNPNKGGTAEVDGIKVTLTDANHSSSTSDGTYAGEPCGLVFELEQRRIGDEGARHLRVGERVLHLVCVRGADDDRPAFLERGVRRRVPGVEHERAVQVEVAFESDLGDALARRAEPSFSHTVIVSPGCMSTTSTSVSSRSSPGVPVSAGNVP